MPVSSKEAVSRMPQLLQTLTAFADVTVTLKMAMMFPIVSSFMLVAFFYFFEVFSAFALVLVMVYSVLAMSFFFSTVMEFASPIPAHTQIAYVLA